MTSQKFGPAPVLVMFYCFMCILIGVRHAPSRGKSNPFLWMTMESSHGELLGVQNTCESEFLPFTDLALTPISHHHQARKMSQAARGTQVLLELHKREGSDKKKASFPKISAWKNYIDIKVPSKAGPHTASSLCVPCMKFPNKNESPIWLL